MAVKKKTAAAKPTAGALLELLELHAVSLREKGVRIVKLGEFEFQLEAPDPHFETPGNQRQPDHTAFEGHPMRDPATYGGRGKVPGFSRIRELRQGEG